VGARVGFIAVEGSPKLLQTNRVDIGLMATKAPFARSLVEVGWGKTDLFHENAGWNRLKIDGLLMVDLAPGLSPFGFFHRMGRATRMFIQIAIDQNPGGSGADSVQTYVGIDFDFRRAFGGFLGR
jgi:hypothetical protein